jgi:carbamoyltransferase
VKFREGFRPYAPSVLEESCGKYFSFSVPSPYMLRAYDTRKEMLNIIPAITHIDGTFNIRGEPIINTVDEAIKCLMTTGLDALFVEDFLIIKDPVKLAPYLT